MMKKLNNDSKVQMTPFLPFASGELDRSGLRLTRAEFARFLDVSRQAVGEWVASGKIMIGTDGRLDPRQAVSQLLRNADPARLRSKVLSPLVKEVSTYAKRIAELETALAQANENSQFNEESANELIAQQDAIFECLQNEREELLKHSTAEVIDALIAWMGEVYFSGTANIDLLISDCIATTPILPDESFHGAPVIAKKEREFGQNIETLSAENVRTEIIGDGHE